MEPLELLLSSSPQDSSRHSAMLFPLQSVISDTSISFYNESLVSSFHENEVTRTHIKREVAFFSTELLIMDRVPRQHFFEIRPILFHNYDPIRDQIDNTGNFLVALQPMYSLNYFV